MLNAIKKLLAVIQAKTFHTDESTILASLPDGYSATTPLLV